MIKWSSTEESSRPSALKVLVYGPPGVGKTMLCATLPRPLIISAEAGLLSLSPANQRSVFGQEINIPVIPIDSLADLIEAHTFVATNPAMKDVDSVCIDSISEIAEKVLANAKRQVKDGRMAYGELHEKMCDVIRKFRDLPGKHVYMTAKMDREKDEVSGAVLFGPSMPGKQLTRDLPHFLDEVFVLGISPKQADGSTFRFLRTRPDFQYSAKDRSGALDEIEQPNLTSVINKIQSHVR